MVGESQPSRVVALTQYIVIDKGEQRVDLPVVEIKRWDKVKREEDMRGAFGARASRLISS